MDECTLGNGPGGSEHRLDRRRLTSNTCVPGRHAGGPIHGWVRDIASSHATDLAVCDAVQTLTYAQLDARGNGLAHRLRALGVRPGARVGLCHERSAVTVIGALADTEGGWRLRRARPHLPRGPPRLHAP